MQRHKYLVQLHVVVGLNYHLGHWPHWIAAERHLRPSLPCSPALLVFGLRMAGLLPTRPLPLRFRGGAIATRRYKTPPAYPTSIGPQSHGSPHVIPDAPPWGPANFVVLAAWTIHRLQSSSASGAHTFSASLQIRRLNLSLPRESVMCRSASEALS